MQFDPEKCLDYYFEEKSQQAERGYDYLWCSIDSCMHKHVDFYELFFVTGGSPCHYYNGQQQNLEKNWLFFFKPGEQHQLYAKPFQSAHFTFFAKTEYFERFFRKNPLFQDVFGEKKCISCKMTDEEFNYIFMLTNSLTHQENEEQRISMLLYNTLSILMMHNSTDNRKKETKYVEDLVAKMNNYTYLTTKIQDIYNEYPVARCTLIQEFKKCTGMTIVQYQKKMKMEYAAQLLLNSGYQITEIAQILEFESLSHFLRIFKEQYGMTPKEYRKQKNIEK